MRWNTDRNASILLICFGLIALALAPRSSRQQLALEPGFFPIIVASFLCLLGMLLGAKSILKPRPKQADMRTQRLRPYVVLVAVATFGMLIRPIGLTGATCALVILSGLASSDMRPGELAAVALGLSAAGVLIFSVLLGLPLGW